MSTVMLSAEALSCERDDRLLFSNLSFSIASGQIWQVIGPNGSGKTTLLRMLSGLYQNYQGHIRFEGQPLGAQGADYNQRMIFIGHKSAIKPTLTVIENLRFLCALQSIPSFDDLLSAIASVGLAGSENVLCRNLSAGQQRRVALARLYLTHAKLWILDEIFTAIDLNGVAELEQFLSAKAREGIAIVLTTHHRVAIENIARIDLGASA